MHTWLQPPHGRPASSRAVSRRAARRAARRPGGPGTPVPFAGHSMSPDVAAGHPRRLTRVLTSPPRHSAPPTRRRSVPHPWSPAAAFCGGLLQVRLAACHRDHVNCLPERPTAPKHTHFRPYIPKVQNNRYQNRPPRKSAAMDCWPMAAAVSSAKEGVHTPHWQRCIVRGRTAKRMKRKSFWAMRMGHQSASRASHEHWDWKTMWRHALHNTTANHCKQDFLTDQGPSHQHATLRSREPRAHGPKTACPLLSLANSAEPGPNRSVLKPHAQEWLVSSCSCYEFHARQKQTGSKHIRCRHPVQAPAWTKPPSVVHPPPLCTSQGPAHPRHAVCCTARPPPRSKAKTPLRATASSARVRTCVPLQPDQTPTIPPALT